MATSLTTLDFLRGLCERNRHWYNSGKCNKRRSCGDADCGIHLVSACVRYDQIEHLLKTLENKVQIVGVKLKAVTNQIVDIERRLRLANEKHYYASAECLLLARLTALAGVVNVLLRYVLVLRYDRLKLEAIKETLSFTTKVKDPRLLLRRLWQCEAMSERAQARLSDSAPPIDEICLANKYVDDENYSIVPRLYSGIMEES